MENYKVSLQLLSDTSDEFCEVGLYAKNLTNLCEYATRTNFQSTFVQRLQKWLEKRRFQITAEETEIELKVEIFSF